MYFAFLLLYDWWSGLPTGLSPTYDLRPSVRLCLPFFFWYLHTFSSFLFLTSLRYKVCCRLSSSSFPPVYYTFKDYPAEELINVSECGLVIAFFLVVPSFRRNTHNLQHPLEASIRYSICPGNFSHICKLNLFEMSMIVFINIMP